MATNRANQILAKFILSGLIIFLFSCQDRFLLNQLDVQRSQHSNKLLDDAESDSNFFSAYASCKAANKQQLNFVNLGLSKLDQFLNVCIQKTGSKKWCDQVARPNPDSNRTFDCTYSVAQPHVFIHPEEATWVHAINAIKLVQELEAKNIGVDIIYNWWRPEPYNANVGGAAARHPFGTSIDVRFKTKNEQVKAHKELCKSRKLGRLRALGFYPGTGLHLGMGDKVANTWGKSCP